MRTPRRPSSHAPSQTALLPPAPSVVNTPKVRLAVDLKQASAGDQTAPPPPRLLDALRHAIRVRHCSIRTEEACVDWARRFIRFDGRHDPRELGVPEMAAAKHPAMRALGEMQPALESGHDQAMRALLNDHTLSNTTAIPCPTPMHMVHSA
jgi:hypothetical protein